MNMWIDTMSTWSCQLCQKGKINGISAQGWYNIPMSYIGLLERSYLRPLTDHRAFMSIHVTLSSGAGTNAESYQHLTLSCAREFSATPGPFSPFDREIYPNFRNTNPRKKNRPRFKWSSPWSSESYFKGSKSNNNIFNQIKSWVPMVSGYRSLAEAGKSCTSVGNNPKDYKIAFNKTSSV